MVNELMRSRVLVVLSSEAFEIGLNRVVDLDTRMSQITRVWVKDAANLFIERVYGWHKAPQLMMALALWLAGDRTRREWRGHQGSNRRWT